MTCSLRGVYEFTVTNTVTGEVVQTGKERNSVTQNWFDDLVKLGVNWDQIDGARLCAGFSVVEPGPYETRCSDAAMVYLEHQQGAAIGGREEGTGSPYIEWRGLVQVFGVPRTFNTFALLRGTVSPNTNIEPRQDITSAFTRVLLATPVEQGADDQVSVVYRIYFDLGPGQNANERDAYAGLVMAGAADRLAGVGAALSSSWTLTQVGSNGWDGRGPCRQSTSTGTYSSYGASISTNSFGASKGPYLENGLADFTRGQETQVSYARTGTEHFFGAAWNHAHSRSAYGYQPRYYFQNKADNEGGTRDRYFLSTLDLIYDNYGQPAGKTQTSYIDAGSPFKNVFMHTANDFSVVYNPNELPTGTWVPTFSGTWAADDHTPLLTRCWVDTAGPVNGTATYKMNFARFGGFMWGRANDEYYTQLSSTFPGASGTSGGNVDHQYFGLDQLLQTKVDPDWYAYTTGDNDSSFGNFGISGGDGAQLNRLRPPEYTTNASQGQVTNKKRFVGLDTNSWWGWSSSPEHPERAGVQFLQMYPEATRQWKIAEIGCNQIDWVEHIKGLPGEVDDEQVLVVDSTSGIYRINYTQNTVTQVTSELGFLYCSYSRDYSSQIEEIIAYKYTDNGDGTFTGSMHSSLISAFAGTDEDFWASVPGGAPTWWASYNDRIVGVRKHYRHPRHIAFMAYKDQSNTPVDLLVLAGDMATGTWRDWENATQTNADGAIWWHVHENHLMNPESPTTPDAIYFEDMTLADFRKMTLWQDWAQFHPDGQYMFLQSMWFYRATSMSQRYFVNTCPGDADFYGSDSTVRISGPTGCAFAPTHNLSKLMQADGSHCYAWGDLVAYNSWVSASTSTSSTTNRGQYIFAPTRSDQQATVPGYKRKWVFSPHSVKPTAHGDKSGQWDQNPATLADITLSTTGLMPGYKGVSSNGFAKRFLSLYTPRDHSSINDASSASLYTHPLPTSASEIDSWPIDGENDVNILNPLRWDVFGWDSVNSIWVKEEWYWNYSTEIWTLDPATAFPGKPIPSDGSTELLSDYGITEYPYAGLQITWEDKRPGNSVEPSYADHSTQVIYNGCFLDGVTEYGMILSQGRAKVEPVTFSATADLYGYVYCPYQGPEYAGMVSRAGMTWKVTDFNGQPLVFNNDVLSTENESVLSGYFATTGSGPRVNPELAGTTVNVEAYKYTLQDNPLSYGTGSWLSEQMPTTAGGLKSPLSGDVGVPLSQQDIVDDGTWIEIAPNGTNRTNVQWIDSTLAPFNEYFPNGVPTVGNRFCRYLVWQPYYAGLIHSDDNDMFYNYNYSEIEDRQTVDENPPTNGSVFGFDTTTSYPYNYGFFYKEHTDAEGREWLVVLCQHGSTNSSVNGCATAYELWFPKLGEGKIFEVRWRYYLRTAIGTDYTPSTGAYYFGFSRRDIRGEYGSRQALIGPNGFWISDSFTLNQPDVPWGPIWLYQGQRWCFDVRPTKDSFASLILPPAS